MHPTWSRAWKQNNLGFLTLPPLLMTVLLNKELTLKSECFNRMSLMIMKHSILDNIKSIMLKEENVKKFLNQIANRFTKSQNVEMSTILGKLVSMRYRVKENIRGYIMEMSNLVTRMRTLKLELFDDILVHLVLISLIA